MTCAVGELLVQLRLLEFGVQAAPPHKDSGNDLIAVKEKEFRSIQVKATENPDAFNFGAAELQKRTYDVLALVQIVGEDKTLALDQCQIFLLAFDEVTKGYYRVDALDAFRMNQARVDTLFGAKHQAPQ